MSFTPDFPPPHRWREPVTSMAGTCATARCTPPGVCGTPLSISHPATGEDELVEAEVQLMEAEVLCIGRRVPSTGGSSGGHPAGGARLRRKTKSYLSRRREARRMASFLICSSRRSPRVRSSRIGCICAKRPHTARSGATPVRRRCRPRPWRGSPRPRCWQVRSGAGRGRLARRMARRRQRSKTGSGCTRAPWTACRAGSRHHRQEDAERGAEPGRLVQPAHHGLDQLVIAELHGGRSIGDGRTRAGKPDLQLGLASVRILRRRTQDWRPNDRARTERPNMHGLHCDRA